MSSSSNPYRLARNVIPSAYRIFITPDLDAAAFAGRVEVDVDIREPTTSLTLHSLDLELGVAELRAGDATA